MGRSQAEDIYPTSSLSEVDKKVDSEHIEDSAQNVAGSRHHVRNVSDLRCQYGED